MPWIHLIHLVHLQQEPSYTQPISLFTINNTFLYLFNMDNHLQHFFLLQELHVI